MSPLVKFLHEDRGAVTVDWVVLTSAIVGLGLATTAVVSGGVESLSNETAEELAGTRISTRFASLVSLFNGDFSGGRGGFTGGTLTNAPGFGEVLEVGQGEMVELTLDVPPGSATATIEFDLIAADDFDGDTATVWVNGQAVSMYTDDEGNISITDGNVAGVSVSVNQQYTNANHGGGAQSDSRATYSITVDNPGTSLT
ncbi:MAG: hypothetical protein AAFW64_10790, partial [Pseudomonadota bacterium]